MPLFKSIQFNKTTQILVWKITESYEELFDTVVLNKSNSVRLDGMKSQLHQRAFLSVRKLLQLAGYSDFDLFYDEFGKPHLIDGKHVSITHSHEFSAIIISDETVGIDIELQRDKIIKIADKFCDTEFQFLDNKKVYIRQLTVIWGAKEAIFKIRNERGISFKNHIKVTQFEMSENKGHAWLEINNVVEDFNIHFEEIITINNEPPNRNFTLVYVLAQ